MLQINWGTLVLQILNFAVMAFILARFFFKPVVRILDERSKKVTSALDEAQRREKEATEIHAEYQEKLAEAEEQVLVIRQQAQDELTRTKEKFLAETRQEVQEMREKAASQLEEARQQATYQHRRELGHLVTMLSARLMRESGGNSFQQASIDQFLARLSALPEEEYRSRLEATDAEVMHVQLASADDLDEDSMMRIEEQLKRMTRQAIEIKHKVDPTLVAGATVRFGDTVIDGSLAGQLQSLNERYLMGLEQDRA